MLVAAEKYGFDLDEKLNQEILERLTNIPAAAAPAPKKKAPKAAAPKAPKREQSTQDKITLLLGTHQREELLWTGILLWPIQAMPRHQKER